MIRLWVWFANPRWIEEIRVWEWQKVVALSPEEMVPVRAKWQAKGFCTAIEKVKA